MMKTTQEQFQFWPSMLNFIAYSPVVLAYNFPRISNCYIEYIGRFAANVTCDYNINKHHRKHSLCIVASQSHILSIVDTFNHQTIMMMMTRSQVKLKLRDLLIKFFVDFFWRFFLRSNSVSLFFSFPFEKIRKERQRTEKNDSLVCRLSIINFHTMCILVERYLEYIKNIQFFLWMCILSRHHERAKPLHDSNFPWACSDDNSSHGKLYVKSNLFNAAARANRV